MVLGLLPLGSLALTTDVKVIYQGWAQMLATGTFPLDDMTLSLIHISEPTRPY